MVLWTNAGSMCWRELKAVVFSDTAWNDTALLFAIKLDVNVDNIFIPLSGWNKIE